MTLRPHTAGCQTALQAGLRRAVCSWLLIIMALMTGPLLTTAGCAWAQQTDSERLGMALEYFQNGKYHEAMLILQDLNGHYRLNPRFQAYLGVCYYYEWDYRHATECLDKALPKLEKFAPQERSFYYFANAESLFNLEEYDRAMDNYRQMLALCRDDERGDAYYKMGMISTFREDWLAALDNLQSAWHYYTHFNPDRKARIAQIHNMIQGCCDKIKEKQGE